MPHFDKSCSSSIAKQYKKRNIMYNFLLSHATFPLFLAMIYVYSSWLILWIVLCCLIKFHFLFYWNNKILCPLFFFFLKLRPLQVFLLIHSIFSECPPLVLGEPALSLHLFEIAFLLYTHYWMIISSDINFLNYDFYLQIISVKIKAHCSLGFSVTNIHKLLLISLYFLTDGF